MTYGPTNSNISILFERMHNKTLEDFRRIKKEIGENIKKQGRRKGEREDRKREEKGKWG